MDYSLVYTFGAAGAAVGIADAAMSYYYDQDLKRTLKNGAVATLGFSCLFGSLGYAEEYREYQTSEDNPEYVQAAHLEDCKAQSLEYGATLMEFDGQYYICP